MKSKTISGRGAKQKPRRRYPNSTLKLLSERASCRGFTARKVPAAVLESILRAGIQAPTGGNLQPCSIIRIEREATRKKLAKLCGQPFIARAPVNLMFGLDFRRLERWARLESAPFTATSSFRHFWIGFQDTIVCAQNICTAADSLGLGSCYIGTVIDFVPRIRSMLSLPKGVFPVVLLCLGYPKRRPKPGRRLGVDAVVHNERYRDLSDRKLLAAFKAKYPGMRLEITDRLLNRIERVCRKVHGEEFARECIRRIRNKGYISMVNLYFGLHYTADSMASGNERFLKQVEQAGFGWFRKYVPGGKIRVN